MSVREVSPRELQQLMASEEPLVIDVREPWEADICRIEGATLIPMRSLPQRLSELPEARLVALYCHHGMRSLMAAQYLDEQGFDALSLAGGIDRWALEVEPSMSRY